MLKVFLRWLVRIGFGFRAYNETALNVPGPVLLLPNHVSWWDWVFIGICLDDDWRFVTSSTTAELSWIHKRIMVNRRTFPVDMNSPYAVKHMAEYLQDGGRLVLFPEGRISNTGALMKLFEGTGFLILKTRPKVITAYIRGAGRLPASRNPNLKALFPSISVHFSEVLPLPVLPPHAATAARSQLMDWLRHRMLRQQFDAEMEFGPRSVPEAIARTAAERPGQAILQDVTLQELKYRQVLTGAQALGAQWRHLFSDAEERVGVLLPNANAFPVVLLSLWAANKVPAILNYTTGPAILLSCARLAGLRHILTSEAFVNRAKLDLKPLEAAGVQPVFLEKIRAQISTPQRLTAWLRALLRAPLQRRPSLAEEPAVVLFTSGSEGDPKGVELSHRNVLANIRQMLAVIDLMDRDRFFNALPLFHSFGLTVGLLLPLVQGTFVFLYLSPLHYRVVPAAFYNLNCTVFFGTNTFLHGYARKAHPYDFHTLRYAFAGAEKLQEATRTEWMQKFGVRVLEGYGATECSPCVSVNLPMHPRPGSAGQLLPAIEYRLDPVEGIGPSPQPPDSSTEPPRPFPSAGGQAPVGRLFLRGPNIMRGYLNPEANARFQALGGWYDTGDIARMDADGFLYLLGRLKRFAKVSGEMVSLTAVEDALANAFPQFGPKFAIAIVSKPDEQKGERLVAVTNEPALTLDSLREVIRGRGLGNLAVPRELKVMHELPRLGTGKLNHRELEKSVRQSA